VRDTAAMLDVLLGMDSVAAYAPALPERPFLDEVGADPGRLRIGWTAASAIRSSPHPEAVAAVESAAKLLESLGHEVEEIDPPHDEAQLARDFLTIWFVRQAVEVDRVRELTGAGERDFERDTRVMASVGHLISGTELLTAEGNRHSHVAALAGLHESYDLLLTPSLGEPPLRVGQLDLPWPLDVATEALLSTRTTRLVRATGLFDRFANQRLAWVPYTQLANMTGRPAMSVPLHVTEDGLPLGVQLVAPLRGEAMLLRLAACLEDAAPWDGRLREVAQRRMLVEPA
jgi:amidase